ncbi:hypothetical protein BH20ACI4_BH20ACI4_16120 [soil metagenome]
MAEFLEKLDSLAGIETENKRARFLERIAFVFLTIMVLAMPHSIAATQTAWLIGMLAWVIRLFMKPRPKFVLTPLNVAFWAFFIWSAISSFFSYAPDISIDKLRNVSLFLIFFFVANNLRSRRAAIFLAFALIFSCMINVVWTPIDRLIGRGVEIHGIAPESPLAKALLQEGDAVLRADGKKLKTPEDLVSEIEKKETSKVEFYRPDYYTIVEVKKADLLSGTNSLEKLGITSWKKSHNWRSAGFYGHYATYAEVLQLIASLVFGLFIAFLTNRREDTKTQKLLLILFVCLLAMSLALLLTVTRASQLAFLISAFSIVLLGGNRKIILILSAIALPLVIGGLIFLQTSRNVGFFDRTDNSTTWRTTVWREGFNLWTESARNFTLGVGMDSIKRYAKDWRLFDDGKLPMGHFHSTPLQLIVERGFPALLLWLWILFIYAKTLIRGITNYELRITNSEENSALSKGVLLGCFGGLVGFFTSGLVHYNLGDAEVAMVFFLLMALAVKLSQRN